MQTARLTLLFTLLLGFAGVAGATDLPGGGQQQEYFIRQQANIGLLIRVTGREAQFEARVSTIDGELVMASSVPGSRLAPLFQYVPPVNEDRQLDLHVVAPLDTNRTDFKVGLSRLEVRDTRSSRLEQGYESLSFGLALPSSDTPADWSIRVNALFTSTRVFQEFGMTELALWSKYFAAQLTLVELGDHNSALQLIEQVLNQPPIRRYNDMRLASLRLRAEALAAQRGAGALPARDTDSDPVQAAASSAIQLATSLGYQYERSEALLISGRDYAIRGQGARALERYEQALSLATTIDADDLATRIREDMLEIHGATGDVAASSEVLQAIEDQLSEDGADDELAQNLLAQGRILNRTFRFGEARRVLNQALEFEHNSLTRDQVRLELAVASYARGELTEAAAQATAVVRRGDGRGYRRATAALDVGLGLNVLANVHRSTGDREAMRQTREAQRAYLNSEESRVLWSWERAQDELTRGPAAAATQWLRQVRASANPGMHAPLQLRAQLWLCRLGTDCPAGAARQARDQLRSTAQPWHRAEGDWLYAAWLRQVGEAEAAITQYESLLSTLIFYRYSVPGVLRDWYWRRSELVARDAMEAMHAAASPRVQLFTLAQLRWLEASGSGLAQPFNGKAAGLDTDAVRALLARLEQPEPGDDPRVLRRDVTAGFEAGADAFRAETGFLTRRGQDQWLASLGSNESVLAYDLTGTRAWAFVANQQSVQRYSLGSSSDLEDWPELLSQAAILEGDAFDRLMASWGPRWLGPVADRLAGRVYLAASGAAASIPFEALSLRGQRPLGEREFLRLASYPAVPGPAGRLGVPALDRVFLAGVPQDFSAGFLERLEPSAELGAVMDAFRGPGLQVVQGTALLPDEFTTDNFEQAGLVHLAMPARINFSQPDRSTLEFSEAIRGSGRVFLSPENLTDWSVSAGLAVLSQSSFTVTSDRASSRPPLVSDLLGAGAKSVLLGSWPVGGDSGREFFTAFYAELLAGNSASGALLKIRQDQATGGVPERDWARYQLWLD